MVVPVTACPRPKATEQVSTETLEKLQITLALLVEKAMNGMLPLTEAPGPEVIRFELAVTGVNIFDEELEPGNFFQPAS